MFPITSVRTVVTPACTMYDKRMQAILVHPRKRTETGKPIAAFVCFLFAGCASTSPAHGAPPVERPPATEQESLVAARTGLWDVTETVWASPDAAPVTTTGLVAERRVIGTMLQEVLRVGKDVNSPIDRIDYLRYSRAEGHWDYVSMDTRADVGIMPAWSFNAGDGTRIDLTFAPFALPTGMTLHMTQVITFEGPDRDRKDQSFLVADGTGRAWLAHRYVYVRRH